LLKRLGIFILLLSTPDSRFILYKGSLHRTRRHVSVSSLVSVHCVRKRDSFAMNERPPHNGIRKSHQDSVHADAARTVLGRCAAGQTDSEDTSAGTEYLCKERKSMRNFRLPPGYKWDLRCSGILRCIYWWSPTFRDNISVPSSRVKHSSWNAVPLTMGRTDFSEMSVATHSFIHLVACLHDRSKASSKASSPRSAIQRFLFQIRVSSTFLRVIQ